ncbi:restriction endonuclease, partial [Myxococcota bacterium]|nr:restriction endonuclease [Myxococcota bacterium]
TYEQHLTPDWVLMNGTTPVLLVMLTAPGQPLDRKESTEGRWRASPSVKLERLLHETGIPIGVIASGEEFRVMYAPSGLNSGKITWTSRLLLEEKATINALHTLLSPETLLVPPPAPGLKELCRLSQDRQVEVADQLGRQVRRGLDALIHAWDAADREARGALLGPMTDAQVYEMGLTVMMRMVFLLYAEERALLPHGEVLYDQAYGITFLWHRLQEQRRQAPGAMLTTRDGWGRILATCRLLSGGSTHPDLSLIAYGGNLFGPDRWPVLEDHRLAIPNATIHTILGELLFARQKRSGSPQRVGYWALDIEEIGYIYEGLLDHRCARNDTDEPWVKLLGATEAEAVFPLSDLTGKTLPKRIEFCTKNTGRDKAALSREAERSANDAEKDALAHFPEATVQAVLPVAPLVRCEVVVPPGWRCITTGTSRRASGSHYTPQRLTEQVVRHTLEPLVYQCHEGKPGLYIEPRTVVSPESLLSLRVADIAMGSGAFLVQVVRYLGDRLVEAWEQALHAVPEGTPLTMPFAKPAKDPTREPLIDRENPQENVIWARRYVAQRCVYGVDVNPLAVEMARLSLWLTTLAKSLPFTFLDHALRCGDSLVGVSEEQITTWSLDGTGDPMPLFKGPLEQAIHSAADLRRQLEELPVLTTADQQRKRSLLMRAQEATLRVRLLGDAVVAPYFASENNNERAALASTLHNLALGTLNAGDDHELEKEVKKHLGDQRTFHWFCEFPEVFEKGGFSAIVGNPPFMGGKKMRGNLGNELYAYLKTAYSHTVNTVDLVAYFFCRAYDHLSTLGTMGLLATNTIAQGDTRRSGLEHLVLQGAQIFRAIPSMPWPGIAAVEVAVVHLAKSWSGQFTLNEETVPIISSALDDYPFPPPSLNTLEINKNKSFQGSVVVGMGFVLEESDAIRFIKGNHNNSTVLFPYLNGKDLNSEPSQKPSRWVINFFDWPLEKARRYTELFERVETLVKPERMKVNREAHKKYWWHYGDKRPALYKAIAPLNQVLVTALVSKFVNFSMVPTGQVFSHKLGVITFQEWWKFAVLQSRFHIEWSWKFSSTLTSRINYSPSDVFETFPFPENLPPDLETRLNAAGEAYHQHRADLMLSLSEGLTDLYNRFHDPTETHEGVLMLHELQIAMDTAVRDAYGWQDLPLEHGFVTVDEEVEKVSKHSGITTTEVKHTHRFTLSPSAKREVIIRLFNLNQSRAAAEA